MTTQYNIGRQLTSEELEIVAAYHNWMSVEQDSDGNLAHDGRPVTAEQVREAFDYNA